MRATICIISRLLIIVIFTICYSCQREEDEMLSAVKNNDKSKIKTLIDGGVSINGIGTDGWTPLILSAWRQNIDMMSYLIGLGADINRRSEKGCVKSAIEATTDFRTAEKEASVNALKFLLQKGAEVKGKNGFDALSRSVRSNNLKTAELLLKYGAPINLPKQQSLLFGPACENSLQICKLLVEHGADVNLRGQDNRSPVIVASQYGNVEVLSYLLSNRAKVTKDDIDTVKHLFKEGLRDPKIEQPSYISEEKQKEIMKILESSL